jgi:hypothetical protein
VANTTGIHILATENSLFCSCFLFLTAFDRAGHFLPKIRLIFYRFLPKKTRLFLAVFSTEKNKLFFMVFLAFFAVENKDTTQK